MKTFNLSPGSRAHIVAVAVFANAACSSEIADLPADGQDRVGFAGDPLSLSCGSRTPKAPVCNVSKCTPDGWVFWPLPANSSCRTADGPGFCDGGELGPLGQIEPDEIGRCIVGGGSLNPQYYVLGVVYAPPGFANDSGQASSVSYAEGSSFGHDTQVTHSFKQGVTVTASAEIPSLAQTEVPLSGSASYGFSTTSTTTHGLAVTKSTTRTIAYRGPTTDGINHDEDAIYLWLNPRVHFAQRSTDTLWTLAINPDTYAGNTMDVQYVKVGWLKGTLPMDAGVAQELAAHNITSASYPALLAMDPFAGNAAPLDATRFTDTGGSFPYERGAPSMNLQLAGSTVHSATAVSTSEHTVGASMTFGSDLTWNKLTTAGSWTWTYSNKTIDTQSSSETATVTVTGPSSNYAGPSNVAVYFDTVYKTFVFKFIEVPPSIVGTVHDSMGNVVAHHPVDLVVNGVRFRTITDTAGEYRFFAAPNGDGEIRVDGHSYGLRVGGTDRVDVVVPTPSR